MRKEFMQYNNATAQIIGNRIQVLRKARGYTQQSFAEMIGLSTNYLSDIERGKSSARLDKLLIAFAIFIDVIKCRSSIKSSRLSEEIEALPPDEQDKIFEIIGVFTKKLK